MKDNIKRIGMVIGTNPNKIELYKKLHSDSNTGVRDLLSKYNYNNFSIFINKMPDGLEYLFAYFEYTGDDFDKDNSEMNNEPRYKEWLSITNSCQIPLEGSVSWTEMERVFFLE